MSILQKNAFFLFLEKKSERLRDEKLFPFLSDSDDLTLSCVKTFYFKNYLTALKMVSSPIWQSNQWLIESKILLCREKLI